MGYYDFKKTNKMKKNYFAFCFMLLFLCVNTNGFAQILAWDFYGYTNAASSNMATAPSTYNNPKVEASSIERGSGAGTSAGYSYSMAARFVEAANSYDNAVANNAYLEFKVKSTTDYISLSGLDVKLIRGENGATKYRWTYKKGSETTFTKLGTEDASFPDYDASAPGVTQPTLELSTVDELQNIPVNTEVTFRLYAWGGTGTTSSNNSGIGKTSSSEGASALVLRGVTSATPTAALSVKPKIVGFSFNGVGTAATANPINATLIDQGFSSAILSRGTGLTTSTSLRMFYSTIATTSATLADAVAGNKFYQLKLTTKVGYQTALSEMLFRYTRSNDVTKMGPTHYQWKYSLDGTNFQDVGQTVSITENYKAGVDYLLDLSDEAALQSITGGTEIFLRLYLWGNTDATAITGFQGFNHASNTIQSIYIKGTSVNVLPVKLTSFNGKRDLNGIHLMWQTASESDNSHFEVYHSIAGKPSELLGKVLGSGTSSSINNYNFRDYTAAKGSNYYQLRQVDLDGKFTESDVIHVNNGIGETTIKVYSGTDGTSHINVAITGLQSGKGTLNIIDLSGKTILTHSLVLNGNNSFKLPFNHRQGIYVASLVTENAERLVTKFFR